MQVKFTASQALVIDVPEESVPLRHYLRQPHRLIHALTEPKRVKRLDQTRFQLTMQARQFMMLSIQPIVELDVWSEPNGVVHVRSAGCEIRGIDYINERFHLDLVGKLTPTQATGKTQLAGSGDLKVEVDLPPLFWMTPQPILEAAGQSLLQGILLTFRQRLGHQLIADYRQWAGATREQTPTHLVPGLSASPSSY